MRTSAVRCTLILMASPEVVQRECEVSLGTASHSIYDADLSGNRKKLSTETCAFAGVVRERPFYQGAALVSRTKSASRAAPAVPQCGPAAGAFRAWMTSRMQAWRTTMFENAFRISEPWRRNSADLPNTRNALDETVSRRVNWLIHVSFHGAHFPERRTWLWHPHSHCCTRARRSHRCSRLYAVNTCHRRKSSTWSTRV